ncbi:TetR/AcrR family transcriptional regulator [Lapillicoccus sp.]|uniref:TetR/AcrR family transcriptional regulator n=1 Tax=Lapillicoccus sp. TaxID=1909287 RepID=UPI0039833CF1
MTEPVKTRAYRSPVREAQAAATRRRILTATRDLLRRQGYAATSVAQVARRARVSVETVYASVGRKPELALAVVDLLLAGADETVPSEQRDYVAAVRAAQGAVGKLETYAAAMALLIPQIAPLVQALVRAGEDDPACRAAATRLEERRAANMRLFAAELRATGELRDDLDDDTVADLIWSTNAVEYYLLLERRGRTAEDYGRLLTELWSRTLLAP